MWLRMIREDVTAGPNGVMAGYRDPETRQVITVCRISPDGVEVPDRVARMILEQNADVFEEMKAVKEEKGQTADKALPKEEEEKDNDVDIVRRDWGKLKKADKEAMKVRELNVIIGMLGGKVPHVSVKKVDRIKMIDGMVRGAKGE